MVSCPGIITIATIIPRTKTASNRSTTTPVRAVRPTTAPPSNGATVSDGLDSVANIAHRPDDVTGQLAAQPRNAGVHHVRPGVEVVPPDLRQQLGPRARTALPSHKALQQEELPVRELADMAAD